MQTFHQSPATSRFTCIASLARAVAAAPLSPQKGQPFVYAGIEADELGHKCLVAKTLDPTLGARLVLLEPAADMVRASLDYLVQRLKSIGLTVVDAESKLQHG